MNRTRVLIAGGLCLVFGATACGNGDGTPAATTEECPEGEVTLSVLRAEGTFPLDDQLDAYREVNECVDFDVSEVPFGQLAEQISVLATSGSSPDIIGYDSPSTADYASQGLLMPLDDYLPEGWHDDVLGSTLDQMTWEESVYSPGIQEDALALYYNKDMTDAAGIDVPHDLDEAWTWSEALDAFQECQVEDNGDISIYGLAPSRLGDGTPGAIYRDLLFQRSAGDPEAPEDSSSYRTYWALSPDGTEVDGWLNTPEAVEAVEWYQELFEGPNQVTTSTAIPNALVDERACFDLEVAANIRNLEDADVDFEWDVAPMPYFETPIVHTGAVTLGVPSQADHPEVAAEAVVEMSTGEILTQIAEDHYRVPVLESSIEEIEFLGEHPYSVLVESIETWGQPRPQTEQFSQYGTYVTEALRDAAYGADAEEMLDRAAGQIDPLLQP